MIQVLHVKIKLIFTLITSFCAAEIEQIGWQDSSGYPLASEFTRCIQHLAFHHCLQTLYT